MSPTIDRNFPRSQLLSAITPKHMQVLSVHPAISFLAFFVALSSPLPCVSDEPVRVEVLPSEIELSHRDAWQTVLVQEKLLTGQLGKSWLDRVSLEIADENVAKAEGNRIIAIADGTTRLIVRIKSDSDQTSSKTSSVPSQPQSILAEVPVKVMRADKSTEWEFRNHVEAVLSRNGCNMGACHGALAGKGGFRLSLRGYDPATDFFNITRQDRGRRIELADPAKSLLVAKPIGLIEHKGGIRLQANSHDYRVLTEWIAGGATNTLEKEPRLAKVEVLPATVRLNKKNSQPIVVRAHYDNGRIEDVTHWAKFTSTDESVATIDDKGQLQVVGPGEGAVSVWFASRIAMVRIVVPFDESVPESVFAQAPVANLIDEHVNAQLRSLSLPPSPRTDDSEFLRRAYVTTIGTLPSAKEVQEFLDSTDGDKRARVIDQLLERPEFVDYWAYRWSDLLMLNSSLISQESVKAYYDWLKSRIAKNVPWDVMVREILTAKGEALIDGATNFYGINQDPENMTENACQAFLGLSIGCAKCHNHPLEKWTNDQYYAMANMFARVRAKGWGGDVRLGNADRTVMVLERGDLIQPLTGKPQPPAPLDAPALDPNDPSDRRLVLADWMTSPSNPYFSRAVVNRVWAAYFGIGIVNSVDDLRQSNPASNPDLMDALCVDLQKNNFDLKSLMRLILNSETFQRSSQTVPGNEADKKFFSHYFPKRMMAEVLHDAVVQVAGEPSLFDKTEMPGAEIRDTKFYPAGTRAIQLYDSSVMSSFLKTFGRNQRRITCECERSDEPSIVQVLHISNGTTVNDKLAKEGSNVDAWMKDYTLDPRGLIEHAFLTALSRKPTSAELEGIEKEIVSAPVEERRVVVEDLLWSLISSREFLFVH